MTTQIDHVEVRWRPTTSQGPFQTQKIPPTQGVVTITGVERGVQYDVQARSVSPRGTASDWVQVQHIVSAANTPLAAPTTLSAVSVADGVHLNWLTGETVLRSDLEFEVWRAPDASGSPGAFALLTTIRGTAFTDGVTDGVLRWYEVREKDQQGNYSAFAAAISSTGKTVDNGATNSFVEGQNLLINPSAGAGDTGWTNAAAGFTPTLDPSGGGFEWLNTSNAGNKHSDNIPIGPGVPIALSADMLTAGITAGQLILVAPCYNAAGTYLGQAAVIPPNGAAWSRYSSAAFTTPANTASIIVSFYLNGATNTNCGVRRIKLEVGTSATPYNDLGTQLGNQLTQAGSGAQVGDKRNLPQSAVNNISSYYSSNSLTWYAQLASGIWSGTITSGAFNAEYDGNSIAYNASTVNLSYGGPGGAVQYWVYFDDPAHAGGTPALVATTTESDCFQSVGRVYVGSVSVTWPAAAGSNSGGYTLAGSKWSRTLMTAN